MAVIHERGLTKITRALVEVHRRLGGAIPFGARVRDRGCGDITAALHDVYVVEPLAPVAILDFRNARDWRTRRR